MILDVKDLRVYYNTRHGTVKAVDSVSFDLDKKEILGIAGESGCGKTTTVLSIMKLLPPNASIEGGEILFRGKDIIKISDSELRKIRWSEISMIFQSSMNALNPVIKIRDQIGEAILIHEKVPEEEVKKRTDNLAKLVGLQSSRFDSYPHEFSGGMKQRSVIAMSLACNPSILIADEPTTALDVIVQAKILKMINEIKKKTGVALIWVTHDLSVIAEVCDRVLVMYAGKIVEEARVQQLIENPKHPYVQKMLNSFPSLSKSRNERLSFIEGSPPSLLSPPSGCRFHPRCNYKTARCVDVEPEPVNVGKDHKVICHLYN
jgi:peptide/nickel transport system ATP-binding protein